MVLYRPLGHRLGVTLRRTNKLHQPYVAAIYGYNPNGCTVAPLPDR